MKSTTCVPEVLNLSDMAMRLEKLLGSAAESWLRMQEAVDLWDARQQPELFAMIKRMAVPERSAA
nr:hypothetical protein [Rhodoferax sp.]